MALRIDKFRMSDRSIKSIIDELKFIYNAYGAGQVFDKLKYSLKRLILRIIDKLKYHLFLNIKRNPRIVPIMRYINERILILTLHFCPEITYLFSVKKRLPDRRNRISKLSDPLMDFKVHFDLSDKLPPMDEINIILRGDSFNRSQISQLNSPIFMLNPIDKVERSDVYYVTSGRRIAMKYVEKGMLPIILVQHVRFNEKRNIQRDSLDIRPCIKDIFDDSNNYRIVISTRLSPPAALGAGLLGIAALSFFANKVNIYGWDQYLTIDPAKYGYWKILFALSSFEKNANTEWGKKTTNPDIVESALYSWCYAYRFSKIPFINVNSYLGQLEHHTRLTTKIERVIYKD